MGIFCSMRFDGLNSSALLLKMILCYFGLLADQPLACLLMDIKDIRDDKNKNAQMRIPMKAIF
jgi:hypothetical protein